MELFDVGVCGYCGQAAQLSTPKHTKGEADAEASQECDCAGARFEIRMRERIAAGKERVRQLFGPGAELLEFRPVDKPEVLAALENAVELTARGGISSAKFQVCGFCAAKISETSKGIIRVERSEGRSFQLEE